MDNPLINTVVSVILAVFSSNAFWMFIQSKSANKSAEAEMLRGLGHDRIIYLGTKYIEQGYITKENYENLHDYLFVPYTKLKGNGTAKRVMDEVEKLPIREDGKL